MWRADAAHGPRGERGRASMSLRAGASPLLAVVVCAALLALPARAQDAAFAGWLEQVREEALARGVRAETLARAFADVRLLPRVIELDRHQPEFTLTFEQYLQRMAPDSRVREGREKLARNRTLLRRVTREYDVQARFLVALWGIESGFGRHTGGFPVIPALATLAFDGRRSAFFRDELLDALSIVDEGHITPERMSGSWAGAMGQNQFMPSSFVRYAVDFDGDGRRDIWSSRADVLASAANYLARSGWHGDQTWGREVRLPRGFDVSLAGLETRKRLGAWQRLGVRKADGGDLPGRQLEASLVLPAGQGGSAYLVYDNFSTILKWNRSTFFALTVGLLADRIGGN